MPDKYPKEIKEEATERLYIKNENIEGKTKPKIRIDDRRWFKLHCGVKFVEKYSLHHSWEEGGFCRLLTPIGHRIIEGMEKEKRLK